MPFVGETLPLSLQLFDFDPGKFTQAALTDEAGTPIAGSPADLVHIGNGKYTSDAIAMPAGVDYVEVTYKVFASAGDRTAGTPLDPEYTSASDVFRFEIPDSVLLDKLCDIQAKLEGIVLPGASFTARLVQDQITEVVSDIQKAKAMVTRDDITGTTKTDSRVSGVVEDDDITGKVDC